MKSRKLQKLAIVVPCMNEEGNIALLADKLAEQLGRLNLQFEVWFVDDGSKDNTWGEVEKLHSKDARFRGLQFSRNFGHQFALSAGLDVADADATIVMDADLQHPPEILSRMIQKWEEGYDLVYTLRKESKDTGLLKRVTSFGFYWIFRKLADLDLPSGAADFRLMDRSVVSVFQEMRERTRFLRGLTAWVGFKSIGIEYEAQRRNAGHSKYNLRKMLRFALDGIVSFSPKPLILALYFGLLFAGFGFLYLAFAVIAYFFGMMTVPGWTSVISLVSLIGGIQLILMGVFGIYLGKIFEEVKQRPLYIVRRRMG